MLWETLIASLDDLIKTLNNPEEYDLEDIKELKEQLKGLSITISNLCKLYKEHIKYMKILELGKKEYVLGNAFNNRIDIHIKNASDIFNVQKKMLAKDLNRMAKSFNFGIIYAISNLNINPNESSKFIDKYYEIYHGTKKYQGKYNKKAHIDGYVKTMICRICI